MREEFPIEPQLFDLYGAVFEVLMKCWLVAAVLLFAVAVILILLCCWETMREARRRQGKAAPRLGAETSEPIQREMPKIEHGAAKLLVGRLFLWITLLVFVNFPLVRAFSPTEYTILDENVFNGEDPGFPVMVKKIAAGRITLGPPRGEGESTAVYFAFIGTGEPETAASSR